jgi:hypothetical protein
MSGDFEMNGSSRHLIPSVNRNQRPVFSIDEHSNGETYVNIRSGSVSSSRTGTHIKS